MGKTSRIDSFYVGDWIKSLKNQKYYINRFLQVHPPDEAVFDDPNYCTHLQASENQKQAEQHTYLMDLLTYRRGLPAKSDEPTILDQIGECQRAIDALYPDESPVTKAILLYELLIQSLEIELELQKPVPAHEAPNDNVGGAAHSANLLSSQLEHNLVDLLDEHGLPDPIALIRKPGAQVLGPSEPEPDLRKATTDSNVSADLTLETPPNSIEDGNASQSADASLLYGYGPADIGEVPNELVGNDAFSNQEPASSLDQVFANQASLPNAQWVNDSLVNANKLLDEPRSADDTVVGITDSAMKQLQELEQALGSHHPRESAHAMQKIVASQVTPDTVGKGDISDAAIEHFFTNELQ